MKRRRVKCPRCDFDVYKKYDFTSTCNNFIKNHLIENVWYDVEVDDTGDEDDSFDSYQETPIFCYNKNNMTKRQAVQKLGSTKYGNKFCKRCDEYMEYGVREHDEICKENNKIIELPQQEETTAKHYIYLLQTREFINLQQPVFKLGKTKNPKCRLSSYPRGSAVHFISLVPDCDAAEKELLQIFTEKFIQRKDLGREYFLGNIQEMIKEINFFIANN